MMLKFKSALLLITLSIFFYACEKEYSLEGNAAGNTAVFSFTGAPGACTSALVAGTYQAGTALGASNTVTISVNVGKVGSYSVATAALNGISFAGSGSFTTIGTQTISLKGSGTPVSAGTFSFNPGTNGCNFPVIISSGGGGSGGTSVFTLNGAPGNCSGITTAGTYAAGTVLGVSNIATVGVTVTTIGTYTISTNTVNGISFTGAGTFTATGNQTVQLKGTGTPLVGGTFNFSAGANSCTFPVIVTGSSTGSGVFTYTGTPASCTNAIPSGTYTVGSVLSASNTVAIDIIVTTVGTYSISTPQVNGFSFSASGNFLTPGAQSVILTGAGTPVSAGISNFTPSNNGCSFPVTVVTATVATDFLKCTIGGVTRNFNENLSITPIDPTSILISGEEPTALDPASFNVVLKKSSGIGTGIYNRVSATNASTYCQIIYLEGITSNGWVTGITPTAGAFTVNVTSNSATRITGTFSGTLYSDPLMAPGTVSVAVTAGSFSIPY